MLIPADIHVFMLGLGGGNGNCYLLYCWRSLPVIPAPPGSEITNRNSFLCTLGMFQNATSVMGLCVVVCFALFSRAGAQRPLTLAGLPRACLFLKFQVLSSADKEQNLNS